MKYPTADRFRTALKNRLRRQARGSPIRAMCQSGSDTIR